MLKLIPPLILLLAALTLPAAAPAQTAGIDEYTESPPSLNGNNPPDDGATTSSSGEPTDPGATATGTASEGALTEAQAAAEGTPEGQLPATGLETLIMVLAGLGFLAAGFCLRKAVGRETTPPFPGFER